MKPYIFITSALLSIVITYMALFAIYLFFGEVLTVSGIIILSLFIGATVQLITRVLILSANKQ